MPRVASLTWSLPRWNLTWRRYGTRSRPRASWRNSRRQSMLPKPAAIVLPSCGNAWRNAVRLRSERPRRLRDIFADVLVLGVGQCSDVAIEDDFPVPQDE